MIADAQPDNVISIADRATAEAASLAAVDDVLIRSSSGLIRPCEFNARALIAAAPKYDKLHFDDFLYRTRIDERDWIDADDRDALCWLQSAYKVAGFTLAQTRNGVLALAHARRRDSLRDYVLTLPAWDNIPRIEMAFIDAWGAADTAITRAAANNFFVALIARALEPGAQVDTLWVFEGLQGTFKSLSFRKLGGRFHAEISAPIGTADFLRELRGLWIAEMSELDSLHGKEASTVKRLLSAPTDRFVEKFEKHASSYPRRAVAIATTNEATYWQDSTGARRLIPIKTNTIRLDLIEQNREQWFAEALHQYRAGATWWEFSDAIADAQDARQHVDPWEDVLRAMIANGREERSANPLATPIRVRWPDGWIASAEIMHDWLRLEPHQQAQSASTRLGRVMRRLGYAPARYGKARERGWIPADTYEAAESEVSAEVSAKFPL